MREEPVEVTAGSGENLWRNLSSCRAREGCLTISSTTGTLSPATTDVRR